MQILYILTYTFTLSLFVFRNHSFLLESSGYQQLEGNMFLQGLLFCFCPTLGWSHMQYMILSQLNVWCFLRGDRRENVVCSMWDCLLVPEEQESGAKITKYISNILFEVGMDVLHKIKWQQTVLNLENVNCEINI